MSVSRNQAVFTAGGLAVLLAAGTLAVALNLSSPSAGPGTGRIANAAYSGFTDCEALLDYYRSHGQELVGPYGLPGTSTSTTAVPTVGGAGAPLEFGRGTKAGSVADSLTSDSRPAGAADPGTGTNVQVAGVDEADVAKRSGDLLLTVGAPPGHVLRPMPSDLVDPVPRPGITGSITTPSLGTSTAGLPVGPGLRILRTAGNRATLLGVLPTRGWSADQLLVRGSTVLLLGPAPSGTAATAKRDPAAIPPTSRSRTRIAQVDIADPAHPRLLRTLDVDGNLVGARLSGGVARLAVSSPPGDLRLVTPQPSTGAGRSPAPTAETPTTETPTTETPTTEAPTTEAESLAANRKLIAASSLADWLPRYTLVEGADPPVTPSEGSSGSSGSTPAGSSRPSSGPLLDCTSVAAPTQFSGLDTLSLLSFDLGRPGGITSWDGAAVVATGTTLYATAEHTYVTTAPWQDWQAMSGDRLRQAAREQRTWIHEFVTTDSGAPRYLASGSVPGFLVNQYALDEYRGDLRVASTDQPRRLGVPDRPLSSDPDGSGSTSDGTGSEPAVDSSQVTVLRADGDRLKAVGSVGGIGRDEQIRGVRFIGPVGYVVTFRQTDPLFTIDLADPARPRVAGELKLLGYSAYLHPAGDGLLLGVGQSADAEGRREGLQLSLFDVSDAAAPRRLANVVLPGAVSTVESDAHAFTFSDQLALIPYHRTVPVPVPRWTPGVPQPGMEPELQRVAPGELRGPDSGVVAVRVDGHKLSEPSVLRPHGPSQLTPRPGRTPYGIWYPAAAPLRTFVDGEAIWTVTQEGVGTHQLPTLRWLGFTTFHR